MSFNTRVKGMLNIDSTTKIQTNQWVTTAWMNIFYLTFIFYFIFHQLQYIMCQIVFDLFLF